MTPIGYTIKNDTTYFHYDTSELMRFMELGMLNGDVGTILIWRKGNLLTYKGFGTIENPRREMIFVSFNHYDPMDGHFLTDDERLSPPQSFFNSSNTKFIMIDLSKP